MSGALRKITVVVLLPETVSAELRAGLPTSDATVTVIAINGSSELPAATHVHALLWVPPADKTSLVALLEAHPEVEWVHCLSAGVDYLAEVIRTHLRDKPIALSNGRGAFSSSLAEYAIGACLYFNKQFKRCEANRTSEKWDKFVMDTVVGKTMGFVGYGHIARSTAALAAPFGLRFVALRRHPEKAGGADTEERAAKKARAADAGVQLAATFGPDDAKAFYAQCDFIVCSLPLTEETRGSVNAAAFASMKSSAVFVSIGRGAAIDEAALYDALSTGKIAGAACDVFATEPLPKDSPLWKCENLLMTAHNADLTADYTTLAFATWRENLEKFQHNLPLATPVDKSQGY
jgi:phosphoglycerate dehydrogenase-like enzyme